MIDPNKSSAAIRGYLAEFTCYYPGILEWYSRVEQEILADKRSVFSVWQQGALAGLAITKNGPNAKLCHISVSPAARDQGIGRKLIRSALDHMVSNCASRIRVTTSETVFRKHSPFFYAAGFAPLDWQVNRYLRGKSEVIWELNLKRCQEVRNEIPRVVYVDSSCAARIGPFHPKLANSSMNGVWQHVNNA